MPYLTVKEASEAKWTVKYTHIANSTEEEQIASLELCEATATLRNFKKQLKDKEEEENALKEFAKTHSSAEYLRKQKIIKEWKILLHNYIFEAEKLYQVKKERYENLWR